MLPEVKNDILSVLSQLLAILRTKEDKDALEVRELSNHVIHDATLFEDKDALSAAVLIYAFSKIMQRLGNTLDYREFITPLQNAVKELTANDLQGYRALVRKVFSIISMKDSQVNLYVTDVLRHSQIKKGSTICEHGISCAKSAQMLNISQWELMQYLGKTMHSEHPLGGHDIRTRLKYARELFS